MNNLKTKRKPTKLKAVRPAVASRIEIVNVSIPKTFKPVVSNNKKIVSRTTILKLMKTTGGKFFTSTHVGKDGKLHTINGIRYKNQDSEMGYIKVYSTKNREMRLVNPQTVTEFKFQGVTYKAKK